jgi:hypothetical protein
MVRSLDVFLGYNVASTAAAKHARNRGLRKAVSKYPRQIMIWSFSEVLVRSHTLDGPGKLPGDSSIYLKTLR